MDEAEKLPPVADGLFEKIKQYIRQHYEPCQQPGDADVTMTTAEVYEAIQRFYPNAPVDIEILAKWLHDNGYTFFDTGKMRFEWLFKSAS